MNAFYRLIATVFCIGYIPVASGTMGSIAALFLYYFIGDNLALLTAAIILCAALGFLTAGKVERFFGGKDSGKIVIDEFVGMLISLYLLPWNMGYMIAAFLLFRFFDIVKPWPIRAIERMDGSSGVMLDDIAAGVYTNLILQIVCRVF